MDAPADATLTRAESGRGVGGGRQCWRAFLTDDEQAAVFCHERAEREFGEERRGTVAAYSASLRQRALAFTSHA